MCKIIFINILPYLLWSIIFITQVHLEDIFVYFLLCLLFYYPYLMEPKLP